VLLVCVFIYVLIRSVYVGSTYDEIWTWSEFVKASYTDIILLNPCDANNHILNTVLIKSLFSVFGSSVFIGRLPNVIAFVGYLSFAFRLSIQLRNKLLSFFLLGLLCLNPFMLDFFGLARGYGLALCFELAALFYLVSYWHEARNKDILLAVLFSFLSVVSNFSFLSFTLGFGAVLIIMLWATSSKIKSFLAAVSYIVFSIIIFFPLNKLRLNGKLYYGGNDGFYADTIKTLIQASTGGNMLKADYLCWLQIIITCIFFLLIVINLSQRNYNNKDYKTSALLTFLLSMITIVIYAQHYVLHTLFPIDRAGIYLIPVSVLTLTFTIQSLHSNILKSLINPALAVAILLVFCNFFLNANTYKTITWDFDSHTLQMLNYIEREGEKAGILYKIDNSWPLNNSLDFYLAQKNYPHIIKSKRDSRNDICSACDYYLYVSRDMPNVGYNSQKNKVLPMYRNVVLNWKDEDVVVLSK